MLAACGAANAGIKIEVNGRNVPTNPDPVMRGGRVFVPLRTISDQFQANLKWAPETKIVTVDARRGELKLQIGVAGAQLGNKKMKLEAAPFIHQGATMVPLRLIGEAYGAAVKWDSGSQTVMIHKESSGGSDRGSSDRGGSDR